MGFDLAEDESIGMYVCASKLLNYIKKNAVHERLQVLLSGQFHRGFAKPHVWAMTPDTVFPKHKDKHAGLVLLFSVGASAAIRMWPAGQITEFTLRSGDVCLFEGALTQHEIKVLDDSESCCEFCSKQRVSIVVLLNPPTGGDQPLTIGKFKGYQFNEILQLDGGRGYASWAFRLENPSGDIRDFKRWLVATGFLPNS